MVVYLFIAYHVNKPVVYMAFEDDLTKRVTTSVWKSHNALLHPNDPAIGGWRDREIGLLPGHMHAGTTRGS